MMSLYNNTWIYYHYQKRSFLYNQMKYTIDNELKQSAYIQLYRQLRDDIVNCVYQYGEKLPSKRLLADETGVSVITVQHAYDILCDEGYAESKERSGYFVTFRKDDFLSVADSRSRFPIPHEPHDEDAFPFSVFAKTMRTVISNYGDQILVKSPNFGVLALRQAISDYLARSKGIFVSADQIVIGSGAEYLYGLIVQFLGRDKLYAIEDPSYEKIHAVYRAHGVDCDLLKLGNDGILSVELSRTRAEVLHITPFRSFPSGVTASASKRAEYIRWATEHNSIIIEDDFDSEFTVSTKYEDTVFSLEPTHSVIYVNTFTQTIAPSMRIGYMVLPDTLITRFTEQLGFYSCTVPTFEQYVLAEFIRSGNFERHINRVRRRRRMRAKLGRPIP